MADKKPEKSGKKLKRILSIAAAVGVFCLCRLFLEYGVILSIFFGLLGYVLARLVLPNFDRNDGNAMIESGLTRAGAEKIINESENKIREIRSYTMKITNDNVANEVRNICRVGMQIVDDFKKDPADIKRSKQFINYYLDSTLKVVRRYVDLSDERKKTPEVEESLKRVEGMLQMITGAFEKQLAKLIEDDVLDLDTEVEVLEKTIKMEGM
jgi:5-bromo-4-chloroindolyl phosphate hydrolysis protein